MTHWWTNCIRLDTHPERLSDVLASLERQTDPIAIDTETTGCDPKTQSPVGRARVWCLTLAWGRQEGDYGDGARYHTAFCPGVLLPMFAPWLRSSAPKVGANIFGYDRHALGNHGIRVDGIVADTVRMSRLLAPDSLQHDLKSWGRQLGWTVASLDEVARRQKPGATYGTTKKKTGDVWGPRQNVSWCNTEMVPVDQVWADYPGRRESLVKYAVQDAAMTLDCYWFLRRCLEGVDWGYLNRFGITTEVNTVQRLDTHNLSTLRL